MNYCHACRRHLNGALACAGCGTPAEYLSPAAPGAPATPGVPPGYAAPAGYEAAPAGYAAPNGYAAPTGYEAAPNAYEAAPAGYDARTGYEAAPAGAGPVPPGGEPEGDWVVTLSAADERRPGARRRSANRRRGRTGMTIGLGLVLAVGGSVAVARRATDAEGSDRASKVMLTDDTGPDQPAPLPSRAPAAPSALPSAKA
ncbi:hypothetical protein ACFXPJ_25865, partial [Streptomyces goshikiensis]